jgi:hypothetical protein
MCSLASSVAPCNPPSQREESLLAARNCLRKAERAASEGRHAVAQAFRRGAERFCKDAGCTLEELGRLAPAESPTTIPPSPRPVEDLAAAEACERRATRAAREGRHDVAAAFRRGSGRFRTAALRARAARSRPAASQQPSPRARRAGRRRQPRRLAPRVTRAGPDAPPPGPRARGHQVGGDP